MIDGDSKDINNKTNKTNLPKQGHVLQIQTHTFVAQKSQDDKWRKFMPLNCIFQIYRDDEHVTYVDAVNTSVANWLRYVNCPRHSSEENVGHSLCFGRIYLRTMVDIAPGTELMVYYGDGYAENLGINLDDYLDDSVCPVFTNTAAQWQTDIFSSYTFVHVRSNKAGLCHVLWYRPLPQDY